MSLFSAKRVECVVNIFLGNDTLVVLNPITNQKQCSEDFANYFEHIKVQVLRQQCPADDITATPQIYFGERSWESSQIESQTILLQQHPEFIFENDFLPLAAGYKYKAHSLGHKKAISTKIMLENSLGPKPWAIKV